MKVFNILGCRVKCLAVAVARNRNRTRANDHDRMKKTLVSILKITQLGDIEMPLVVCRRIAVICHGIIGCNVLVSFPIDTPKKNALHLARISCVQ